MDEDEDRLKPEVHDWLFNVIGYRDFVRLNFGLYHPPGDYRALRAENLRRSKDQRFSRYPWNL